MTLPPGPRRPPAAQTAAWIARPLPFIARMRARFGDVFTVRLASVGTYVFVADPGELKRIFTAPGDVLRAGASNTLLEPVLGPRSVLLLDGAEHLRQRRLLLPPFHGERIAAYRGLIGDIAAREARTWPRDGGLALQPRLQRITLEVILRAVFGVRGVERTAELARAVVAMLDVTGRPYTMVPWIRRDLGPGSPWRAFLRARARVDALIYAELSHRREVEDLDAREDVLSLLLGARDEDGVGMTDGELRDELMTLLVAGHETTATGLAWALAELARRPGALRRARDEPEYTEAVVLETLRRRPPIPIVARAPVAPWRLGGAEVAPPAVLAPCIWLVHHREDLYPDPFAFRPERWLDRTPGTYEWLPFGGGLRRCLGASFALLEMEEVLRAVLAEADLAPAAPGALRTTRRAIVLAPRGGGRVLVR